MILRNSHCLPAICPGQCLESKDAVFPLITACSLTGEIHTRALASTFDDGESGPLAVLYFILCTGQLLGDSTLQRPMVDRSKSISIYFVCS